LASGSQLPLLLVLGLILFYVYKKGYIGGGTPPGGTPPGGTPPGGVPTGGALFATVGDIDTESATAASLAASGASTWIGLGDYAYSGSIDDWAAEVMAGAASMTWYGAQGNHDSSDYSSAFNGHGRADELTVSLGPVTLICCNTESFDVNFVTNAVEQAQADPNCKLIIPFMHYPIQTPEGSHHGAENSGIHEVFQANSKVKLVLNGHNHNYTRMDVDGIKYVCVGCGGRDLYPVEADSLTEVARDDFHGIAIAYDKGTGLQLVCKSNDGETIDDFTVNY
jgi:acid phosphatase type 7